MTAALSKDLEAAGPALNDEAALRRLVAFVDNVLASLQGTDLGRQAVNSLPLFIRQGCDALQFADEHGQRLIIGS